MIGYGKSLLFVQPEIVFMAPKHTTTTHQFGSLLSNKRSVFLD